jgi:hypothetical protein
MILQLKSVGVVRGCYGPKGDQFPARAAYFAPDVADAFVLMLDGGGPGAAPGIGRDKIAFSDIWRSGESSLAAVVAGRGAQPPGFSGHNFGVSFDLDVEYTRRALGIPYAELLKLLAGYGWHCYRQDGGRGPEDWHFNYLGTPTEAAAVLNRMTQNHATWQGGAEAAIAKRYPAATFALGPADIQAGLKKLGLYHGDVDGKFGPLSLAAAGAFCRAWRLPEQTGPKFSRTLAFVSADIARS